MQKIGSWVLLAALAVGTVYFSGSGRAGPLWRPFLPSAAVDRPWFWMQVTAGRMEAVSLSGVPESGINLAIVQKLDQLLGLYGERRFCCAVRISTSMMTVRKPSGRKKSPTSTTVWPGSRRQSMLSCSAYTRIPFRTGSTTALRCSIPTESSVNLWHNSHRRHCGPHWTRATPVRQSPSRTASI